MRATRVRHLLPALFLLGLSGCPKPTASQAPPAAPPATVSAQAGAAPDAPGAARAHPVPSGVVVLDEARLKHFLEYQGRLTELSGELVQRTQELERRYDGGLERDPAGLSAALALVQKQSEGRRRAAQEVGLTETEITSVERMVSDILGRRLAQNVNQEALVQQLEDVMAHVPADQREDFERALKQARSAQDESKTLGPERARYGDANVDLVLAHEDELRKRWTAVTAGLSGVPTAVERATQRAPATK
jgi:hypothetical protein